MTPRRPKNYVLAAIAYLILFFLLAPLTIVIPVSLTAGNVPSFPPQGLSLRWYHEFFADREWMRALWISFTLGIVVAITSTVTGLCAAFAMSRLVPDSLKPLLRVIVLAPLIVPAIVGAIAMFLMLSQLRLVSTFPGLVICHTILALPYTIIVLENGLLHLDASLEEAARTLGANRFMRLRRIVLPLMLPSIVGSAVFAFITSFDEIVAVLLVGGASYQTLPVKMFVFLENELKPTPAVVSSLLVVGLLAAQGASYLVRGALERRRRMPQLAAA
ncbi:MAG TPA: ABC transporter permease [Pseudolabrys sp.]|nr:ABC transporter permease [Pseudolabrys sp.]